MDNEAIKDYYELLIELDEMDKAYAQEVCEIGSHDWHLVDKSEREYTYACSYCGEVRAITATYINSLFNK